MTRAVHGWSAGRLLRYLMLVALGLVQRIREHIYMDNIGSLVLCLGFRVIDICRKARAARLQG